MSHDTEHGDVEMKTDTEYIIEAIENDKFGTMSNDVDLMRRMGYTDKEIVAGIKRALNGGRD
jgi:hypothetical protein